MLSVHDSRLRLEREAASRRVPNLAPPPKNTRTEWQAGDGEQDGRGRAAGSRGRGAAGAWGRGRGVAGAWQGRGRGVAGAWQGRGTCPSLASEEPSESSISDSTSTLPPIKII